MANWRKVKTEYITGDTSYRKLSQKYKIPLKTIGDRAKAEHWVDERTQYRHKTETKTINAIANKEVERAESIQTAADRLLGSINQYLDVVGKDATAKSIRELTAALKDLQNIQHIKSDIDLREQEARIANLQKQAKEEEKDNQIILTVDGGDDLFG